MLVKNKIKKIMAKKREKSMKAFAEAGLGRRFTYNTKFP